MIQKKSNKEDKKQKSLHVMLYNPKKNIRQRQYSRAFVFFFLSLYTKNKLHAFVGVEAHCRQGNHLDIPNREADEEATEAALPEDHSRRLSDSQPSAIANSAANLHASSDYL